MEMLSHRKEENDTKDLERSQISILSNKPAF